jgi:hypothetical protein
MRVINHDSGNTTIDEDGDVLVRLNGVNPGDFIPLDISGFPPDLDTLSALYLKAQATKRLDDADAYKRHKARIIAMFERRDIGGSRYE